MKQVVYIMEMLTDVYKGVYTQWIYYSDGSTEVLSIPKGKLIVPREIYFCE